MRYVVTGCAGFIGSHLSEALLRAGHTVVGVDAFTDYYDRALKEANLVDCVDDRAFTLVEADLAQAPLDELIAGTDGVFHLAAQPGVRGSWGDGFPVYVRDNVLATQRIFEAAVRAGVRVVWASTSSVYGDAEAYPTPEDAAPRPISPYGVTKACCERLAYSYAHAFRLDAVALRYFTVYGPRQRPDMAFTRVARALANDAPFPLLGSGRQSRDVTYVGDAVSATVLAMEAGRPNAAYNVGGGSETTLAEAIAACEAISGRTLRLERHPSAAGDVRRTAADTRRAREHLGWRPAVELREGLRAQLAWAGIVPASAPAAVGRAG